MDSRSDTNFKRLRDLSKKKKWVNKNLRGIQNYFFLGRGWLWLIAGSEGKFVFNKGEMDVATPGVAFATLGADRGTW